MFPPRREMRRGNILAAILLAGPVIAGAIMVFALVCRFFRPFAAAEAKARQKKLCRLAGVLHGAVLLGPCPDVFDP